MKRSALAAFAVFIAVASIPVRAHHSVSAWFDTTSMTEIEGEVTDFRWQNPHVVFTLKVTDSGGTSALWDIETLSISGISRWGITQDLFNVGDHLRVAGNPARRSANNIFVRNILLPSGREIVMGGTARWSEETLRGSELLQAKEGDGSRPDLGIYRTWSSGSVGGVLFPEAVQANFDFSRYPLTAAARAARERFDFARDDPTKDCTPKGMPTVMEQPYPMVFIDQGDTILMRIEEYDTRRTIYLDERSADARAAAAASPRPLGYSVGHWEGGSLVVTTTRSSWGNFDSVGIPLSVDAVMVERFTPSEDGAELDYRLTVTDPSTFTMPVELTKKWIWRPEIELGPFECRRAND